MTVNAGQHAHCQKKKITILWAQNRENRLATILYENTTDKRREIMTILRMTLRLKEIEIGATEGLLKQGFSNFFSHVPPIFFGCICVPPWIFGNIITFHNTRASAISCVAEIWIHSSLVLQLLQYGITVTTLQQATHCDSHYFRYCQWLIIRLKRLQCHVIGLTVIS